jgi:hypothetical protein
MRPTPLIAAALSLVLTEPAFAWIEYASQADHFSVNFPAEPEVRDIEYVTEYSLTLPGRVYSYDDGPSRYSVTVIDFSGTEAKHAARLERCRAELGEGDSCLNPWDNELHGAITHVCWELMQRAAKVTHFSYYVADMVEGRLLQLTNADDSRTFAAIHMHENRLYIMEGTVPAGAPEPGLFQQSLGFIDENGDRIRYRSIYSNGFPPPPSFTYR